MSLANARFYDNGRFFWDERAATLEEQVLQPIQDSIEMGMSLDLLINKLKATTYYPSLFAAAYGSGDISSDGIARALAQFVRAMVSAQSPFDSSLVGGANNTRVLSNEARLGQQLFNGRAGCNQCHSGVAMIADRPRNNGLDITATDLGAGRAQFKVPSLRNVAVRAPYMHDGRFATLREVVEFYNSGVQASPNLDGALRRGGGGRGGGGGGRINGAQRLNLTEAEKSALVAFMESLTDSAFLTAPKFSNPFPKGGSVKP